MILEQQYAEALYQLVVAAPNRSREYLEQLVSTLKHKGHTQLLPRIFSQFEKILERKKRSEIYSTESPEKKRTRILLELYRTLIK